MTTEAPQSLAERIFAATLGALELQSIHIGRRLGLYETLREPHTVAELAQDARIGERYAREWLEQQATAGFVSAESSSPGARFSLNEAQQAALTDTEDLDHISPFADMIAGGGLVIDQVVEAYRSGGGVPYADYGKAFRDGQAAINRPAFTHDLASSWVNADPGVAAKLRTGGKVADLGCGGGWSTIAMAKAFPKSEVIGIDVDEASITDARVNAGDVDVEFVAADASGLRDRGPFDLVMLLEVLHDLAKPVEVLAAAREALAPGGVALVADEKVGESFTPNGDELERMMYAWSVTYCLPASLSERPSAGIGTVLRPGHLKSLAEEAGFGSVEISDIDAGFFRLYVLRP